MTENNTFKVQVSLFLTRVLGGKAYFLLNREEIKDLPKVDLAYGEKLEVNMHKILDYLGKVQIEKSGFLKFVNNYSEDPHLLEIGMIAKLKRGEPKSDSWIWYRSDRLPENLSTNAKSSIMAFMSKNPYYEL